MNYSYFSHHRFVSFRQWLGYTPLSPGVYLTFFKHQGMVNSSSFMKKVLRSSLPEIYIETELTENNREILARAVKKKMPFFVRGTAYRPTSVPKEYDVKETGTFIVDLRQSLDDIWERFDHSLQKQLKKDEAHALHFSHAETNEEVRAYYRILRRFRDTQGFKTPAGVIIEKQWEMLHGGEDSNYEVFTIADTHGTLLAGMGVVINPDTKSFIEVAVGHSPEARNVPAMDTLRWNIIKWGKEHGLEYYDLAGVELHALPGSKEEGILRYKKKWGGNFQPTFHYERYFRHNRAYYPLAYQTLQWMHFIKK